MKSVLGNDPIRNKNSRMTKQEKEYNKVIAEFMGYPTKHYWWHHRNIEILNDTGLPMSLNEDICKFHEKYDWLMPVWVKFRDLNLSGELFGIGNTKSRNLSTLKTTIRNIIVNDSISEALTALAEAIIWYNENKE